jgi:hypothetical protein
MAKEKAVIGTLIRVCSGGRHAWFNSSAGVVRKAIPIVEEKNDTATYKKV